MNEPNVIYNHSQQNYIYNYSQLIGINEFIAINEPSAINKHQSEEQPLSHNSTAVNMLEPSVLFPNSRKFSND
jgi:hypothetical protein